ncbi:MAG: hypothetical protein ACFFBS_04710 [Promethearchaeota archaeon]
MGESEFTEGAVSQLLFVIGAALTIIVSLVVPIIAPITGLYETYIAITSIFALRPIDIDWHSPLRDLDGRPYWASKILLPSIVGIINSGILLVSIVLLVRSVTGVTKRFNPSDTGRATTKSLIAVATFATVMGMVSSVLFPSLIIYSFREHTGGIIPEMPPFSYDLNIMGWALLILEVFSGGLMILLVGILFLAYRNCLETNRLWYETGIIYILAGFFLIAGTFCFSMLLSPIGLVLTIIAGIAGTAGFAITKTSTEKELEGLQM